MAKSTNKKTRIERAFLLQQQFNYYVENEDPQPQVVFAFGLRITN